VRRLGADRTIVNSMTKRIRTGIGPQARTAVRAGALAVLPHRGGLAAWVARLTVRVAIRRGAQSAGVNITGGRNSAGARSDVKAIDAGRLRHPTGWGPERRGPWVLQSVNPGFFSESLGEETVTQFREVVVASVNEAVRELL
jgi:hypothetical protein